MDQILQTGTDKLEKIEPDKDTLAIIKEIVAQNTKIIISLTTPIIYVSTKEATDGQSN